MTDVSDDIVSNFSGNRPFADIVEARLSRRSMMIGGLATAAAAFFAAPGLARAGSAPAPTARTASRRAPSTFPGALGFDAVPLSRADRIVVPPGYSSSVILPWGDPIRPGGPAWRPDASNTAAEQAEQIGMGHDGIFYFPLGNGNQANRRGLIVMNHEYTVDAQLFPDGTANWSHEKTLKSQHAHGVSVVEVHETRRGRWQVKGSRYARRIHVNTPMAFSGPAAGNDLLKTAADPSGTRPTGTANNCGSGPTPWGTYLTCEENFNGYFAATGSYAANALQARYGVSAGGFGYRWHTTDPRFDLSSAASTNEENTFGWVVEIDPYDPSSTPVKRTALGRFKHEAAVVVEDEAGRAVVYMGDDERFEYLYKFVSSGDWRSMRAAGISPLDEGTLYVARFDDAGTGTWLPLVHGQGPLTEANGFTSQGDVVVRARAAADALGATPMDRPEWAAVAPDGRCYLTCTNNTSRRAPNGPNPRTNNVWGHIVSWDETAGYGGTTFDWDVFLLAGPAGQAGSTTTPDSELGSPDGLWADQNGLLWIQTDGRQPNLDGAPANDQMVVADPATGEMKRFLTGVVECEVTGVHTTPDGRTMFVNIQHPGDGGGSTWPTGTPGAIPRPATVVITKDDGGVIGS